MRRATLFLLFAMSVFVVASPARSQQPIAEDKERSAVAGDFTGDYRFMSTDARFGNQGGSISLSISGNGKVTGSAKNNTINAAAEVSGTVNADGEMKISIEFSNQSYTAKGTVTKTKKGSLRGTLTQYSGKDNAIGSIEFDLPAK